MKALVNGLAVLGALLLIRLILTAAALLWIKIGVTSVEHRCPAEEGVRLFYVLHSEQLSEGYGTVRIHAAPIDDATDTNINGLYTTKLVGDIILADTLTQENGFERSGWIKACGSDVNGPIYAVYP